MPTPTPAPKKLARPCADCAHSTPATTWTPITFAHPDTDETVLVYMPDHDDPVWLGFLDIDGWYLVDGTPVFDGVTHWAPMPEGPNGQLCAIDSPEDPQ